MRPSVWKAIKDSIALAVVVHVVWLVSASYDRTPPLTLWGSIVIVGLTTWLVLFGTDSELRTREIEEGVASGFWGPYQRAMLRGLLLGCALAAALCWYLEFNGKQQVLPTVIAILFIGFSAAAALSEVMQCAGRLRDRPFLAGLDDLSNGAILGLCLGFAIYAIAVRSVFLAGTTQNLVIAVVAGMIICGVTNVWRKNAGSISFLNRLGEFSIEVGSVFTRFVAFTKGCLWLGLAVFIAWLTVVAFPEWAPAKACGIGAAVLAGLVGLRELGPVLRVREAVSQQVHGRADKAKESNALSAASGAAEKPPWVNHGYRD